MNIFLAGVGDQVDVKKGTQIVKKSFILRKILEPEKEADLF